MDGRNVEPRCEMHHRLGRLHELLRHANGGALDAMGAEKYRGLTRKSGSARSGPARSGLITMRFASRRLEEAAPDFVNSMSDLFHEGVPAGVRRRVWDAMEATPRHTYQILTKRPDRMT